MFILAILRSAGLSKDKALGNAMTRKEGSHVEQDFCKIMVGEGHARELVSLFFHRYV